MQVVHISQCLLNQGPLSNFAVLQRSLCQYIYSTAKSHGVGVNRDLCASYAGSIVLEGGRYSVDSWCNCLSAVIIAQTSHALHSLTCVLSLHCNQQFFWRVESLWQVNFTGLHRADLAQVAGCSSFLPWMLIICFRAASFSRQPCERRVAFLPSIYLRHSSMHLGHQDFNCDQMICSSLSFADVSVES